MSQKAVALAVGLILLSLTASCGTADLAPEQSGPSGAGDTASATAVASSSASATPTVDRTADVVAQRVLAFTRENVKIRSGEPVVVLSRPVTPSELSQLGLGTWNFAPGCVPRLWLVIVKGDLDLRGLMPAALPPDRGIPVKYIAYTYDLNLDEIIGYIGDPDGAQVKQALGDPTLPDADPSTLPNPGFGVGGGQPIPCQRTTIPGGATPSPSP